MRVFDADHDGVLQPDEVERLKEHTRRPVVPQAISSPPVVVTCASGAHQICDGGNHETMQLLVSQNEHLAALSTALQRHQGLVERQDERLARLERMLMAALEPAR